MASVKKFIDHPSWEKKLGSDELPALAFIECSSISRGLFLTDIAIKKAPIKMIVSQPVSSGKHVLLFYGDVASVEESREAVIESSDNCVIKDIVIPNVHPQLSPFLDSIWSQNNRNFEVGDSVGIIESQTLSAAILSADQALKAAEVSLCKMRLGQGIGGKAYFVLTGRQEEVEAANESAQNCLKSLESYLRVDLIARPDQDVLEHF